jgi:hypothetical protein
MPRNRVPAETLMHEGGPPSSPCGHRLSVEPLKPPTRSPFGRRARSSLGCRGLRPRAFWGAADPRAIIVAVEQRRRFTSGSAHCQVSWTEGIAAHHQTAALTAPRDHSVSSRLPIEA